MTVRTTKKVNKMSADYLFDKIINDIGRFMIIYKYQHSILSSFLDNKRIFEQSVDIFMKPFVPDYFFYNILWSDKRLEKAFIETTKKL